MNYLHKKGHLMHFYLHGHSLVFTCLGFTQFELDCDNFIKTTTQLNQIQDQQSTTNSRSKFKINNEQFKINNEHFRKRTTRCCLRSRAIYRISPMNNEQWTFSKTGDDEIGKPEQITCCSFSKMEFVASSDTWSLVGASECKCVGMEIPSDWTPNFGTETESEKASHCKCLGVLDFVA